MITYPLSNGWWPSLSTVNLPYGFMRFIEARKGGRVMAWRYLLEKSVDILWKTIRNGIFVATATAAAAATAAMCENEWTSRIRGRCGCSYRNAIFSLDTQPFAISRLRVEMLDESTVINESFECEKMHSDFSSRLLNFLFFMEMHSFTWRSFCNCTKMRRRFE